MLRKGLGLLTLWFVAPVPFLVLRGYHGFIVVMLPFLLLLCCLSVQAQPDKEEKDGNPMLMARVDELLEEASPLKGTLLLMGNAKEVSYLNEIGEKRKNKILTVEEAEEFTEQWESFKENMVAIFEQVFKEWADHSGLDPFKPRTITEYYTSDNTTV